MAEVSVPSVPDWRQLATVGVVVTAVATGLAFAVVRVAAPPALPAPAIAAPAAAAPAAVVAAPSPSAPAARTTRPSPSTAPPAKPALSKGRAVYVVYEGQTLTELARRFGTTVDALVRLNHISDRDLIRTGQRIRVS